jgi:hypothetical protein
VSIDPIRLVQQQKVAGRTTHYHCPGCDRVTRDSTGMCISCRRSNKPTVLTGKTIEALVALRGEIDAELARRAVALKKAMGGK